MGADRPAFISVIRAIRGGGFQKSFGCPFASAQRVILSLPAVSLSNPSNG